MQTPQYKFFIEKLLREKQIQRSSISRLIRSSDDYITLYNAQIIEEKRTLNGGWVCSLLNEKALLNHYQTKFPIEQSININATTNAHTFRDSKAQKRTGQSVVLLRGIKEIKVNGNIINIGSYTKKYGLFSTVLDILEDDKICFVENLDSFLRAEEIFGANYTFIHSYGRPGRSFGSKIKGEELIVFPDYDYVGLKDYLNIKKGFPDAQIYIPENFEWIYDNFHRLKPLTQQQYQEVMESTLPEVIRVRNKLIEKGKMLEQQKLFKA